MNVSKNEKEKVSTSQNLQICAVFLFSFFQRVGQYFSVNIHLWVIFYDSKNKFTI